MNRFDAQVHTAITKKIQETNKLLEKAIRESQECNALLDDFLEKADMPQEAEHIKSCDMCGKDLYDGESAIGITTGDISDIACGFMSDETAWLHVACKDCGAKIMGAIEKLIDEEGR